MQNDTISRSALVAELEAFKMSLGDVVLRLIVDRVIEIVKAHKAAAPRSVEIKVTPSPSEGEVLERFGLAWFPDLSEPDALGTTIEERLRDGWRPCKWAYEAKTDTDYRCFVFLLERALR